MPVGDPFGFSGTKIDAQIQVDEPIGEGGFSVVYRGRHLGLDEPVAVKCLKMPPGVDAHVTEGIVERFRAESRISYRLSQGNLDIVRSLSSGAARSPTTDNLVPFIALEWLDGPSLGQELRGRRAAGMKGRPLGEVVDLLDPAAVALDYAHKQGVVHRDVKPGNLVLARTREGGTRMKVLDFGLAKVIDPEGIGLGPTMQTVGSIILCSPAYGAPEQFNPSFGPVGSYTDVYSFALIVLEMLRDEKLRSSASIALAAKEAASRTPVSPIALGLQVPQAIDALFQRTLQPDKTLRPKDLGEFWGELRRHLPGKTAVLSLGGAGGALRPLHAPFPLVEHVLAPQSVTRPIVIRHDGAAADPEPQGARPAEDAHAHEAPRPPRTVVMSAPHAPASKPPDSLPDTRVGEPVPMSSSVAPPVPPGLPPRTSVMSSPVPLAPVSARARLGEPSRPDVESARAARTVVLAVVVLGLTLAGGYLVSRWLSSRHAPGAVSSGHALVDTGARAT